MQMRQQMVVEQLRDLVMSGELEGGQRLQEVSLAERLQVSRTPIREALIVLAEEGLVEYRPNRGYVVRNFTLTDILDAYQVRQSLEVLACRLAAKVGLTEKNQHLMLDFLNAGDELLAADRLDFSKQAPWREVNDGFHSLILNIIDNATLTHCLKVTMNIPFASSRVVHWFDEEDMNGLYALRMVHDQHWSIYESIKAKDEYRAETAMRWHISYAVEHIKEKFGSKPASDQKEVAMPRRQPKSIVGKTKRRTSRSSSEAEPRASAAWPLRRAR